VRARQKQAVAVLLTMLVSVTISPAAATAHGASPRGYVGTVSGTRAFVAVVVRGSHVVAYVCDSRKIAQWFKGVVHAQKATLISRDGYVLHVTLGQRRATGSLRFPGQTTVVHGFAAGRDAKPSGLWRGTKTVRGRQYLGGWVILRDGRQRGEVVSGSTDVGSPRLNPADAKVPVKKKGGVVVIAIIAILIG
jgi:hypothetical protein